MLELARHRAIARKCCKFRCIWAKLLCFQSAYEGGAYNLLRILPWVPQGCLEHAKSHLLRLTMIKAKKCHSPCLNKNINGWKVKCENNGVSVNRRFSLWFQGRCAGRTSDSTLADKALAGHEIACEVMKLTKELLVSSFMTIRTITTSVSSSATASLHPR